VLFHAAGRRPKLFSRRFTNIRYRIILVKNQ
jgi:hypothetical protein